MSGHETLFECAYWEFRILELDQAIRAWTPYPQANFDPRDGYAARQEAIRLNADYAEFGRKFMVQRRALSHWGDLMAE